MRYYKLTTIPALAAVLALGACAGEEEAYQDPALEEPVVTEPVTSEPVLAEPNAEPLEPNVLEETGQELEAVGREGEEEVEEEVGTVY